MAEPPRSPAKPNELEQEFDRPLLRPETEEGMGPTLGEDVSSAHQRDVDKRNRSERA